MRRARTYQHKVNKFKPPQLCQTPSNTKQCQFNNQKNALIRLKQQLHKDLKNNIGWNRNFDSLLNGQKIEPFNKSKNKIGKNIGSKNRMSMESQMIIKNSLMYRKLENQFQNMRKDFNKEKAFMNNSLIEVHSQLEQQKASILKLRNKKRKLAQQLQQYTNQLISLQNQNYEIYWDMFAHYQFQAQQQAYEDMLELEEQIGIVSKGMKDQQIQKFIQQFKCSDSIEDNLNSKCCICCDSIVQTNIFLKTNCDHIFHCQCLKQWLKRSKACPLCRNQFDEI